MISRCYATSICNGNGVLSDVIMNKIVGYGAGNVTTTSPKEIKAAKANRKASTDVKVSVGFVALFYFC